MSSNPLISSRTRTPSREARLAELVELMTKVHVDLYCAVRAGMYPSDYRRSIGARAAVDLTISIIEKSLDLVKSEK